MDLFSTLLTTSFTQPCAGNVLYISKPLVLLFSPWKVLLPPSSTVKIWLTFQRPNPHHLSRCHHDRCYYLCGVFSRLPSKINLSLCAHSQLFSVFVQTSGRAAIKRYCHSRVVYQSGSNQEQRSQANYFKQCILIQRIGCRGNIGVEREPRGEPQQKVSTPLGWEFNGKGQCYPSPVAGSLTPYSKNPGGLSSGNKSPRGKHGHFWSPPGTGERSWLLPSSHPQSLVRPQLELPECAAFRGRALCHRTEQGPQKGSESRRDPAQAQAVSVPLMYFSCLKTGASSDFAFVPSTKKNLINIP